MNPLFRRATSLTSISSSRLFLTSLLSGESFRFPSSTHSYHHHQPFLSVLPTEDTKFGASGFGCRGFHSRGGVLRFRATDGLLVQHAVDEYSYDEKAQGKSGDEGLEIAKLGIAEVIVKELAKKGISKLFPIQRAVLEPAMEGRDLVGRAKTGTGKTLAFGIPIMDKIIKYNVKNGRGRNPLALILAPTRELARQVEKEFRESSDLDTLCAYGGSPINQQMSALDYGVDVVVGTPGRIIDLLKRGALNLSEVQFLVLDEADQMLAVGFAEDVEVILEKLPQKHQSMMFSATMPSWIRQLTRKYLNDPLTVDLVGDSDQKLAEGISLYSIVSDNYGKASIIGPLVTEHAKGGKCIVFTQTKRDADRLSCSLKNRLRCEALHGDISQSQRERTLSAFRDGRFNVLVATDVAARGLDIPNVDLVIHYELPNSSEIFVHRSGRTGRAGKKGNAILIYTEHQMREVRTIEQHVGSKFTELPRITIESAGHVDMFGGDMGGGSYGKSRFSDSGFGRSGGFGGSGSGRSGGNFGGSSGRFGGYSDSGSGRSGFFGGSKSGSPRGDGFSNSRFGGGLGDSSRSGDYGRSGGFGNSRRSEGFGDLGRSGGFGDSRRSGGGFGNSSSSGSSSSGSSRSGGFGNSSSSGSSSSGSSRSGGSGSSRFSFDD